MADDEGGGTRRHEWEGMKAKRPVLCFFCKEFVWQSTGKNGLYCVYCERRSHKHCMKNVGCKDLNRRGSAVIVLQDSMKEKEKRIIPFKTKKSRSGTLTVGEGRSLFIHVLGGRNLVSRDNTGFSDPYVSGHFNQEKFKTKTIQQSLFPRWNEVFEFTYPSDSSESKILNLVVMDWDRLSKDDFMGQISLDLSGLSVDRAEDPTWYTLQPKPGKASDITGEIQLKIEHVTSSSSHIEKRLRRKREIFLQGPVKLKKGKGPEEKTWIALFSSEEIAFLNFADPIDSSTLTIRRNGSTTKRCMSQPHLMTKCLEEVCMYSREGNGGSSQGNPKCSVKEEFELCEISSIESPAPNQVLLNTTRNKMVQYLLTFTDEEEALEYRLAFPLLRERLLVGSSQLFSLLEQQYKKPFNGGCLKSSYNEEWQYMVDGTFRCVESADIEGVAGSWDGESFLFSSQEDQQRFGFGTWDGSEMNWWKAPQVFPLINYTWKRMDHEYLPSSDSSSLGVWMWTRHFLANKDGAGEWIVEGSVPESLVMFFQIFYSFRHRIKKT